MDTARVYVREVRLRLAQLYGGLILYGISSSLLVLANLGLDPWDVFHQGLSRTFGLAIGTWAIIVGVVVLLLWIPLRQKPGLGTASNVVLVGLTMNVVLGHVHPPHALSVRIAVSSSASSSTASRRARTSAPASGPGRVTA